MQQPAQSRKYIYKEITAVGILVAAWFLVLPILYQRNGHIAANGDTITPTYWQWFGGFHILHDIFAGPDNITDFLYMPRPANGQSLLLVLVSIVLGIVTYRVIESRVTRHKPKTTD